MPSGTVTPAGGSGSGFLTATVSLTNAQVLGLASTPVQLIAAPASNQVILSPASGHGYGIIHCDTTTAAYTNVDSNALFDFSLGNNSILDGYYYANNLLTFNGNAAMPLNPAALVRTPAATNAPIVLAPVDTLANVAGQPLMLDVNNAASGAITGGDPANTFVVKIGYLIVALT